ncbi:hypothetical protein CFP56_008824 [Quercus suber]|uniref:Uncharacterized protein n=1 Tax=Quercus suber TaxID=58331 RepID=A0AAW0L4D6_QUESU
MYKSSTIATKVPEEMAHTPVEVGTRGTVGSLIMKEIEYFSQLELSRQGSSQKPQFPITDKASSSSHSRPTFGSVTATQKKKNKAAGSYQAYVLWWKFQTTIDQLGFLVSVTGTLNLI